MESKLDRELPAELLGFRENIEATLKPYIEIKAKPDENLRLWQSKFGGFPCLPVGSQYPTDSKGRAMFLLGQINLSEIPKLQSFPEEGILQFYIINGNDLYGMGRKDLTKQDGFRVHYFPEILEDESKLITDFTFLPKFDMLPLRKSCSLTFSPQFAPMSIFDCQFDSVILGKNPPSSRDEESRIRKQYEKLFPSIGHKIGGYPFFTQTDPRSNEKYRDENYVLLFQMDTDGDADIMWGDSGVGNFFIREQDLQERHFSNVLYTWDCC